MISWNLRFHICQRGLLAFPREIRIRTNCVNKSTVLRTFAGHGGAEGQGESDPEKEGPESTDSVHSVLRLHLCFFL